MSSSHMQFVERIERSPQIVFDLIADMPNYGRWLAKSDSFGATTEVSPYPVCLGTTYLDAGPLGRRPGSVTAYDPPHAIAFHQTMDLKRGPLTGNADIHIAYDFEALDGATNVTRAVDLTIEIAGFLRVLEPLVRSAFRKENARVLGELKRYAEALPAP